MILFVCFPAFFGPIAANQLANEKFYCTFQPGVIIRYFANIAYSEQ
jgi:hypothetical protein